MPGTGRGQSGDGVLLELRAYRLHVSGDGLRATLSASDGTHWLTLRPLAALDCVDAPDETLAVSPPVVDGRTIRLERRSTRWERAAVELVCGDEALEVRTSVTGRGRLAEAHLLAARSLLPGRPTGYLPSGTSFRTLFSPNPGDPARLARPAGESAVIGVAGDGEPGRGHWFFTPAPLFLAFALTDPAESWLGLGVAASVDELTFVQLEYRAGDRAFGLVLDYEGHTAVDGEFRAPTLVLAPGAPDPYAGLARHRSDLVSRGAAPAPHGRPRPAWWSEPIFCGWGAQCHLARTDGGRAPDHATQADYDSFLDELERNGVVPGTIVLDDKWQAAYGTNEPDREKWPDLRGWIARRHERGQRVLLWWKAWDAEGLAPELCVRNPDGVAVALDPTNPDARAALRGSVTRMLAAGGLDADGLKVDFTARTPSGRALTVHGESWGIALLHELLAIVYAAAKEAKPDALIVTHTPHPGFVDVTDMIRLNDMLRLDDEGPLPPILPQMRHRAAIVRAAAPELLVDTDDWCVPSLEQWRAYTEEKTSLGVPALYYASNLDWTGERLERADYEALRRTWERWRVERA